MIEGSSETRHFQFSQIIVQSGKLPRGIGKVFPLGQVVLFSLFSQGTFHLSGLAGLRELVLAAGEGEVTPHACSFFCVTTHQITRPERKN